MKKLSLVLLALLFSSVAWGQKISQLPNANTLTGSEYMPMVQAGTTVKSTPAQVLGYIDSQTITWSAAQTFQALATFSGGVSISSGATVAGGLTVSSGGLTVSSGNLAVNSGNLSVSGTSTLSGAVTASAGLTATTGGLTATAGGLTVGAGGANITGDENLNGQLIATASGSAPTVTQSSFWVRGGSGVYYLINSGGATNQKEWDFVATAGGQLEFRSDTDDNSIDNPWLLVARSGATPTSINFPYGAVEVSGQPKAFGAIANNGSSCSISPTGTGSYGLSSCVRNSTGDVTINFSVTSSLTYICTAMVDSTAGYPVLLGRTTTAVEIKTYNSSGTAADLNFELNCN